MLQLVVNLIKFVLVSTKPLRNVHCQHIVGKGQAGRKGYTHIFRSRIGGISIFCTPRNALLLLFGRKRKQQSTPRFRRERKGRMHSASLFSNVVRSFRTCFSRIDISAGENYMNDIQDRMQQKSFDTLPARCSLH